MAPTSFFELIFWLLFFHALADYPLQGFLAQLKNRRDPINDPVKQPLGVKDASGWGLYNHAMIHGGFVFYATGMIGLGIAEAISHALIDWLKCEKRINFHQDQWMHIALKVLWAVIAINCQ
jgi:hypothetical protein